MLFHSYKLFFPLRFARISFLCLMFFLLGTKSSFSQRQAPDTSKALTQFMLDAWTTEDGLPNNSVMAQVKAADGYFWLITYDGLVRFDGLSAKVFNQRNTPSFATSSLLNVFEDSKNRLWIGTNGKGVLLFEEETFKIPAFNENLPNETITSFAEEEGRLWIGSRGGLACLEQEQLVKLPDPLPSLNIYCLLKTKEALWIGTLGKGLWRYNQSGLRQYTSSDGLPSNFIRSLALGKDGRLWIGTEKGIAVKEEKGIKEIAPHLKTFVNGIEVDHYGTVWFGTDAGLLRYANQKFDLLKIEGEAGEDNVQAVLSDEEGSVWFGTYRSGFMRLRDGKFTNYTLLEGLPNEVIHRVYPDEAGIWIGTDNGLALLKENQYLKSFKPGEGEMVNRVRDIVRDKEGRLYIGTYAGLYTLEEGVFRHVQLERGDQTEVRVRRLLADEKGGIWVGTNSGLYALKNGKVQPAPAFDVLQQSYIMSLCFDHRGRLWIGTNGNGIYFAENDQLQHFAPSGQLASEVVFDIVQDKGEGIWFMTNNGLSLLVNGELKTRSERDGLFANTFFQLQEDESGACWLSTNRGIFQLKGKTLKAFMEGEISLDEAEYKHFTKSDGLGSDQVTPASRGAVDAHGQLWFATLKGVSAIDPQQVPRNTRAPRTIIEKVKLGNGEEYAGKESLHFPAGTKYFEFAYTGLNYRAPAATRFQYQLENFEEIWHDAGTRRVAYYTNIPAGEYTFRVKAANEDGVWSSQPASISFVQEAYFYEHSWFKVLSVLLLVALAGIIFFWRIRMLKARNYQLSKIVEKRTSAIVTQRDTLAQQKEEMKHLNQLKDQLLSTLSHEVKGPLISTLGVLNLFHQNQLTKPELQKYSAELAQLIGQQLNRMESLLGWARNQMSGFLYKPAKLNLFQVVEESIMLYRQEAELKKVRLENHIHPAIYVLGDKNLLHLVLRNLLVNAIKFSVENGVVKVSAAVKEGVCQVEVEDNGLGMNKEQLAQIFRAKKLTSMAGTFNKEENGLGLAICKEFVQKWGGRIWAESYLGKGSRFKITIREYEETPVEEPLIS